MAVSGADGRRDFMRLQLGLPMNIRPAFTTL